MIFGNFSQEFGSPFMFEVWLGNAMVENYQIHTPMPVAYMQFLQIADKLAKDKRPMKVGCHGVYTIEHPSGDTEDKPSKVIFYNATYESEIGIDE